MKQKNPYNPFIANQLPTPLTLGELISYGAIEGSEDAYGKLILRNCFANGKFEQEKFN